MAKKQRHTAKRIYERLRTEYGFGGKYTIVKDYLREHRLRTREMYVPLTHPAGHAQCDFGQARAVIGGVEQAIHYFALDLAHSDGCFIKAYPAETTEAFCDGHVAAFSFLGGVPRSILYDNTRLAVAKIMGDGRRQRTRVFSELVSHYLFEDRFGRPGKGNDKGKVEGLVGYARRNFLVPVPSLASFDALNAHLEERCLERLGARLRGCDETIGERMERDLEALLPLPDTPYDASGKRLSRVSSLSLVRYRSNDYSAPAAYGHRDVIEAGDERRLLVLQKKLSRLKLLIIDELGFVPLSKTGAELLFEVFSQRYERGSILLTTNLPFDKWTEALGSERLTGALLDRLTHRVHILEMNGESYRLRQSRQVTTLLSAGSPADPWLTPPTQHTSHRSRRGPHDPVLSG